MSEDTAAAVPAADGGEKKQWKKTAGGGEKRRGPPCDHRMGPKGAACPRNGLYEVDGHWYCLTHARQRKRRQAKLNEQPGSKNKEVGEPTRAAPKRVEFAEAGDIAKVKSKPAPPERQLKDDVVGSSYSEDETDGEEEENPMAHMGKQRVEMLAVDVPQEKRQERAPGRSPDVKEKHREYKKPERKRRRQDTSSEESDSEDEMSERSQRSPVKRKSGGRRNFQEELGVGYRSRQGESALKNMFKGATQLNTFGAQRKPSGKVFGLFK
jgi:hypothetical protein